MKNKKFNIKTYLACIQLMINLLGFCLLAIQGFIPPSEITQIISIGLIFGLIITPIMGCLGIPGFNKKIKENKVFYKIICFSLVFYPSYILLFHSVAYPGKISYFTISVIVVLSDFLYTLGLNNLFKEMTKEYGDTK